MTAWICTMNDNRRVRRRRRKFTMFNSLSKSATTAEAWRVVLSLSNHIREIHLSIAVHVVHRHLAQPTPPRLLTRMLSDRRLLVVQRASRAVRPAKRQRKKGCTSCVPHLHDVLAEGILCGRSSLIDITAFMKKKKRTHLLTPILNALLALLVSLPGMQEKQTNKSPNHAAENTNPDDNIHPGPKMPRNVERFTAHA